MRIYGASTTEWVDRAIVIVIRTVEIPQSLSENQSFKVTIQSNSDDDDDAYRNDENDDDDGCDGIDNYDDVDR